MKECVKTDMDSELHVFQREGGGEIWLYEIHVRLQKLSEGWGIWVCIETPTTSKFRLSSERSIHASS